MDAQQPISGDLKELNREHKQSDVPSILERRQMNKVHQSEEPSLGYITPMPTGPERMAALRDLGATFEEGQKTIAKVATPTETVVPSFVDSDHLEEILHENH